MKDNAAHRVDPDVGYTHTPRAPGRGTDLHSLRPARVRDIAASDSSSHLADPSARSRLASIPVTSSCAESLAVAPLCVSEDFVGVTIALRKWISHWCRPTGIRQRDDEDVHCYKKLVIKHPTLRCTRVIVIEKQKSHYR